MNKIYLFLILSFLGLIGFASSCRKSGEFTTISDRVEGKWKLARFASDDNLNGTIDNYEIHTDTSTRDYELLFNKDGSGINTNTINGVKSPDLKFTWYMVSYDSLRIAYQANDTLLYHVSDISSKQMTLTYTSKKENSGIKEIRWFYFVKI